MNLDEWPNSEQAIKEECDNVDKIEKGANIVGSMFTLNIKCDTLTGQIEKYKTRLVALGNQQHPGSYKVISSQTVRSASVKTLLAIQANTNSFSMFLDVKCAYLNYRLKKSKRDNYT